MKAGTARPGGERGFVLLTVLLLAIAYFGLMQLMLMESSEALRSASQFRSRVLAQTLAENGVELGVRSMMFTGAVPTIKETAEGSMTTAYRIDANGDFEMRGAGSTTGAQSAEASVKIFGKVEIRSDGTPHFRLDRTIHSQ